jgi:glycosyltransferase involved in cell wall biosynthesis
MITHVAVVIPARNESELVRDCLVSVQRATRYLHVRRPCVRVGTFIVLDSCTDESPGIIAEFAEVTAIHAWFSSVGASRAAGVRWGMSRLRSRETETWIANTDSTVPRNWLAEHVRLADAGHDLVLGTVQPVRADLTPRQAMAWDVTHPTGRHVGHVHGANLGVRASSYLATGGFAALEAHEDVDIVERLRAVGARGTATDACPVTTSGRSVGRAPTGYAEYVRSLDLADLAAGA